MQLTEKINDEDELDDILRNAADGYGDLIAAALSHNVSLLSLQKRLSELRNIKAKSIS
jgi:hypothetical protein